MCDSHGSPLPLDGQLCWSLQLPILLQFLVVALAWLSIRLLHGCTSHTSTHAYGGYFECPSELWAANSRSWFCLFPLWFVIPCRGYPGSTQASERTGLLFTFIISVAIFLALSCLMGWHVYLVLTAQVRLRPKTPLEFLGQQSVHVFCVHRCRPPSSFTTTNESARCSVRKVR